MLYMPSRNLTIAVNDEIIEKLNLIVRARGEKWSRNAVAREAIEIYLRQHMEEIREGGPTEAAEGQDAPLSDVSEPEAE